MLPRFRVWMLALPRLAKSAFALGVDCFLLAFCVWLTFCLRLERWALPGAAEWWAASVALIVAIPMFVTGGLYRAMFRYSGSAALVALTQMCGAFFVLYGLLVTGFGIRNVPRSVGISAPILFFIAVGGARLLARYWLGGLRVRKPHLGGQRVVIYGAGAAGRQLAAALSTSQDKAIIAFVDDSSQLHGCTVNGMRVFPSAWLTHDCKALGITDVLLAMPSVTRPRRAEIVSQLLPLGIRVRTVPSMDDLACGRVRVNDLHEIEIGELLGRDPVAPVGDLLQKNVFQKVVLVTGAGGSIGSELCRQIILIGPSKLILVDASEYALYTIQQELNQLTEGSVSAPVIPLLLSVFNEPRMRTMYEIWRPETVYHAAAYKHVPMVEHNAVEGIRNNTLGTLTTALLAVEFKVHDFVLISTDKAVRPTNIMGASKRLAEMVLQGLARESTGTRLSMVRFGNVLGSSGSVVPMFSRQIRNGGPVTVTHPEITRYFMTITEAAQLVIQAGAMATSGDVFILDMGTPIKIIDLARKMIELSGLSVRDQENPKGDIPLLITGLRPGEKLYEELLIGDGGQTTPHPRIMKAQEDYVPWQDLWPDLLVLSRSLDAGDVNELKRVLHQMVPGYQPAAAVVDWLHTATKTKEKAVSAEPPRLLDMEFRTVFQHVVEAADNLIPLKDGRSPFLNRGCGPEVSVSARSHSTDRPHVQ